MSSNHSTEFKQNAIKLAIESDQSVAQTARDLGINANTLYTWISNYQKSENLTIKKPLENNPYDELKQLRREVAILKEERDILKKATAYFAKNHR